MQLFTVTEIAQYLKQSLDRDSQLQDLWVSGEVSNLVRSAAGHAYFTLKDASAQIRCALFRGGRDAELLTDGGAVNAHGRVSFYENRGQLQLYVDMVQPSGLGALALELERLKTQLDEEGLFDPSRKRPLPLFPKRIGVVTSEQGAVLHDIRNVVERRYPLAELVVCASAVQGDQAVSEVIDALRTLNAEGDIDVIIVARGGGSLEELSAFNSEQVARAIHASHAPVVSAVGHETDVTIADLVADVRAPTPSAAAELATLDAALLAAEVYALAERARSTISYEDSERRQSLESLSHRMRGRLPDISGWRQRVDDLLGQGSRALITLVRSSVQETSALQAQLQALNPSAVLGRGYAVVAHKASGAIVTSAGQVKPGDVVETAVHDGRFDAVVSTDAKNG